MCASNGAVAARATNRFAHALTGGTVAILCACATDQPMDPSVAGPNSGSQFSAVTFTAIVDTRTRVVSITSSALSGTAASRLAPAGAAPPSLSLLGSDVVRLVPSNLRVSALGAVAPKSIRVTFGVTLENRLPTLTMIAPTWPAPPAPYVIMFPLDYSVTSAPGGVVGGDGNSIGVGLPGGGKVTPSDDWNGTGAAGSGAPYSFFANTRCSSEVTNNCFRWITFGSQSQPVTGRPTRTVGFDIDASVTQFRARMIVAADLIPAAAAAP
jgi:hypothetical protein